MKAGDSPAGVRCVRREWEGKARLWDKDGRERRRGCGSWSGPGAGPARHLDAKEPASVLADPGDSGHSLWCPTVWTLSCCLLRTKEPSHETVVLLHPLGSTSSLNCLGASVPQSPLPASQRNWGQRKKRSTHEESVPKQERYPLRWTSVKR